MAAHEFTREQFYDLVWQQSRLQLAETLGTTPAMITSVCENAAVPAPGRGYFAKLEAGKPVEREPLPTRGFGEAATVHIGHDATLQHPPRTEEDIPLPTVPEFPESMESVLDRARATLSGKKMYSQLRPLHSQLERALDHEAKHPFPRSRSLGRREHILLNNLLWLLDPFAKFNIRVGFDPIYVRVGQVSSEIQIQTNPTAIRLPWDGVVGWTLPMLWRDGAQPLEMQVHEIAATILAGAELYYRLNSAWRLTCALEDRKELRERLAKQAAEEEKRLREEREQAALARRARLFDLADNLSSSDRIRELAAAVAARYGTAALPEDVAAWLKMARAEADALDPRLMSGQQLMAAPQTGASPRSEKR